MYLQLQPFAAVMPLDKLVISSSAIEIIEKSRLKFVVLYQYLFKRCILNITHKDINLMIYNNFYPKDKMIGVA